MLEAGTLRLDGQTDGRSELLFAGLFRRIFLEMHNHCLSPNPTHLTRSSPLYLLSILSLPGGHP